MDNSGDFSAYLQNLQLEKLAEMSDAQAVQIGFSDEPFSLSSASQLDFQKAGHEFVSWNTKPDGTGTSYAPGDVLSAQTDVMLYAQWKQVSKRACLEPVGVVDAVAGYSNCVSMGTAKSGLKMPFTLDFDEDHDLCVRFRVKPPEGWSACELIHVDEQLLNGSSRNSFAIIATPTGYDVVDGSYHAITFAVFPERQSSSQWFTVTLSRVSKMLSVNLEPDTGGSATAKFSLSSSLPQLLYFGYYQTLSTTVTQTVQKLSSVRELVPAQDGVWTRKSGCLYYPDKGNGYLTSGVYGYEVDVPYSAYVNDSMKSSHHIRKSCGTWKKIPEASSYQTVNKLVSVEEKTIQHIASFGCYRAQFDFSGVGCGLTANGTAYYLKAN